MKPWWIGWAGLLMGLLGDWWLRGGPWGLGACLWAFLLTVLASGVGWGRGPEGRGLGLLGLWLGMAGFGWWVWRDTEFLLAMGTLGFASGLALWCLNCRGLDPGRLRLREVVLGGVEALACTMAGPGLMVRQVIGGRPPTVRTRWMLQAVSVVVGLVFTVLVVGMVGFLLRAGDPLFRRWTDLLLAWRVENLWWHGVMTAVLGWFATGYLWVLTQRRGEWVAEWSAWQPGLRLGWVTVALPLAALNGLFVVWGAAQFQYWFGGLETVLATAGLTVAGYARRGFFELVMVAALVPGVVWLGGAILDRTNRLGWNVYRGLSGMLWVWVGWVMVSAVQRLGLYVGLFGLTESRVYAGAVLGWVAAAMVWFGVTVWRGRPERFLIGVWLAGLVWVLVVGACNPQGWVARVNLARAAREGRLDVRYLAGLGADAVPVIVEAWDGLSRGQRMVLEEQLLGRWRRVAGDWRSWNYARWRASRAVRALPNEAAGVGPEE